MLLSCSSHVTPKVTLQSLSISLKSLSSYSQVPVKLLLCYSYITLCYSLVSVWYSLWLLSNISMFHSTHFAKTTCSDMQRIILWKSVNIHITAANMFLWCLYVRMTWEINLRVTWDKPESDSRQFRVTEDMASTYTCLFLWTILDTGEW